MAWVKAHIQMWLNIPPKGLFYRRRISAGTKSTEPQTRRPFSPSAPSIHSLSPTPSLPAADTSLRHRRPPSPSATDTPPPPPISPAPPLPQVSAPSPAREATPPLRNRAGAAGLLAGARVHRLNNACGPVELAWPRRARGHGIAVWRCNAGEGTAIRTRRLTSGRFSPVDSLAFINPFCADGWQRPLEVLLAASFSNVAVRVELYSGAVGCGRGAQVDPRPSPEATDAQAWGVDGSDEYVEMTR